MTLLYEPFMGSPAATLIERFLLWSLPIGLVVGALALAAFALLAGSSPVWRYRVAVASSLALLVTPLALASVTSPPMLWGRVGPVRTDAVAFIASGSTTSASSEAAVSTNAPDTRGGLEEARPGRLGRLSATRANIAAITVHAGSIAALLWLVTASVLVLRVAAGLHGLARLRAASLTAPPRLAGLRARVAAMHIDVRISSGVPVPLVAGWLHPCILLPAEQARELDEDELVAVIAHEHAHIQRNDHRTGPAMAFVAALTFFHPVSWWLGRVVRTEREFCCDDFAIDHSGAAPARYAATLARLAVGLPRGRSLALTGGALLPRLERLQRATRSARVSYFRRGSLPALLASLLLVITVGHSQAPAVSDRHDQPQAATVLRRTGLERVIWLTSIGWFELSEDGRLVTGIEPGGRLVIEELVAPVGRRGVVIEGNATGTPTYRYTGDSSAPPVELGSTWLRRILTEPLVVEMLAKREKQAPGASRGSQTGSASEVASFLQLPLTGSADLHERQAQWLEQLEHFMAEGDIGTVVQQASFEYLRAAQLLSARVYDDAQYQHVMSRQREIQDAIRETIRGLGGEVRFRWLEPEAP